MSLPTSSLAARLSVLDRFLPLWIFLAMALGVGLGRVFPALGPSLDGVKVEGVSLPIALGLFAMMSRCSRRYATASAA